MPTWIKTNKEEYTVDEQYDIVDVSSFSEMQKLAYDIVNCHFDDTSSNKEPLALIINGVAGTGKSYLIKRRFFRKSRIFHQMRSKLSDQAFVKNMLCRHLGFKFFVKFAKRNEIFLDCCES